MAIHAPTDKTVYDYPDSPHVRAAIRAGRLTLCGTIVKLPTKITDHKQTDCPHCLMLLQMRHEPKDKP